MPGSYDKVTHLDTEDSAVAQELAHQVCQASIELLQSYFPRGSEYQTMIDGKPNGDLEAKVVRNAFSGEITSFSGHDLIYEDGKPVKKMLLRYSADYRNTQIENAQEMSGHILYFVRAFTILFLGTFLAVLSNLAFFLSTGGLTSIWIIGGLAVISYGIAAGIGAFFGERIGDLILHLQGKKTESDSTYFASEERWCECIDELRERIDAIAEQAEQVVDS